jgi:pimeloyl-ACP methyl ester carboxylesterase
MTPLRKYGTPPYSIAVVHGGPGAAGEMAPVARKLSSHRGVLEPLQTAATLEGQVQELRALLEKHADLPVVLVGHSWGAWLAFIVAARYPALAAKVVLVGSGPFEDRYAAGILKTRLSRLGEQERKEALSLLETLQDRGGEADLARLGAVLATTDDFDPLPAGEECEFRPDIFRQVWGEAERLRRSGDLLAFGRKIRCPVVAVHGDYDPHPAEGVAEPLSHVLPDFRFILLEGCGHTPWCERRARERFYVVLEDELTPGTRPAP